MSGAILPFRRSGQPAGWTNQELAELQRVGQLLANAGLPVASEQGVSDEGDPWFVFIRTDCDEVVAHIARIDGWYMAAAAGDRSPTWGASFRAIADSLMALRPLAMPQRRDSHLFTHPIAILAAFVATALVQAEPARAASEAEPADPGRAANAGDGATSAIMHGAIGPAGKSGPHAGDTSFVSYALAAVASALAVAMQTDPAFAGEQDADFGHSLDSGPAPDPADRISDADLQGVEPTGIPDFLLDGSDHADWSAGDGGAFGRLLPQTADDDGATAGQARGAQGEPSGGPALIDHHAADADRTVELSQAGQASAKGFDVVTAGVDAVAVVSRAAEGGREAPNARGQGEASASTPGSTSESPPAQQDSSGEATGQQASTSSDDKGSQQPWHAFDLGRLIDDLGAPRDPADTDQASQQAAAPTDEETDGNASEAGSGGASGTDDTQTGGTQSSNGEPPLRDTDGDGVVILTDSVDVVLYDGGELAVEGFEPGIDRLVTRKADGFNAIAVNETGNGDLELVFEHDGQSVTFVGVSLEDFAAL
jgi:hypothetical protein